MRVETRQVFIAEDDTEFTSESDCLKYNATLSIKELRERERERKRAEIIKIIYTKPKNRL